MSTHSTISVFHNNGKVSSVYCHFDGHLEHVGSLLAANYGTLEKAEALVAMGDISSLGKVIIPSDTTEEKDVTVFFHRDRGENLSFDSFSDYDMFKLEFKCFSQEYNYLFKYGEWWLVSGIGPNDIELVKLTNLLVGK
jgi:hypothetical protein